MFEQKAKFAGFRSSAECYNIQCQMNEVRQCGCVPLRQMSIGGKRAFSSGCRYLSFFKAGQEGIE